LFNSHAFPQFDKFASSPFKEYSDCSQRDNDDVCLLGANVYKILVRKQAFSDSLSPLQEIRNGLALGGPTIPEEIGTEMALLIDKSWNPDPSEQLSLEDIVDGLKESAVWDMMSGVGNEIVNIYLDETDKWEAANCPS
jgi:hypothetical protein